MKKFNLLVLFLLAMSSSAHAEWSRIARLSTLGMASVGWMSIETGDQAELRKIRFSYGNQKIDFTIKDLRTPQAIVPSWAYIYSLETKPHQLTFKVLFNQNIDKTKYGSEVFTIHFDDFKQDYELLNSNAEAVSTINVNFKTDAPWHPLTPLGIKSMSSK